MKRQSLNDLVRARRRCPHIIFDDPQPGWRGKCWACGVAMRMDAQGRVVEVGDK